MKNNESNDKIKDSFQSIDWGQTSPDFVQNLMSRLKKETAPFVSQLDDAPVIPTAQLVFFISFKFFILVVLYLINTSFDIFKMAKMPALPEMQWSEINLNLVQLPEITLSPTFVLSMFVVMILLISEFVIFQRLFLGRRSVIKN